MNEYDKLLEQAKKAVRFVLTSTAKKFIPKMYDALRNENPNITSEDARDRIEKDCVSIWSRRTILNALPDEAKDPEKQKAGRLRQKEAKSAAFSAAPHDRQEVVLDAQGRSIDNDWPTTKTSGLMYDGSTEPTEKVDIVESKQNERSANTRLADDDDDISGLMERIESDEDLQYSPAPQDDDNFENGVFTIYQEDFDDLANAMSNSTSCCYLKFDTISGELLGVESD